MGGVVKEEAKAVKKILGIPGRLLKWDDKQQDKPNAPAKPPK